MTAPARRATDRPRSPDIGWILTSALTVAAWLLIAFASGLLP